MVFVEISLGDVAPQLVMGIQQPLLLGFRETVLGLSQNRAVRIGVLDGYKLVMAKSNVMVL